MSQKLASVLSFSEGLKLLVHEVYSWQHINESKLLHTYVMNEFLAASWSRLTKYFWKTLYQDL